MWTNLRRHVKTHLSTRFSIIKFPSQNLKSWVVNQLKCLLKVKKIMLSRSYYLSVFSLKVIVFSFFNIEIKCKYFISGILIVHWSSTYEHGYLISFSIFSWRTSLSRWIDVLLLAWPFCDWIRSFDTVDHQILLGKLILV